MVIARKKEVSQSIKNFSFFIQQFQNSKRKLKEIVRTLRVKREKEPATQVAYLVCRR